MAVVTRYGNTQRQRLGLHRAPSMRAESAPEAPEGAEGEENSIEAMVAGVKSRGVSRLN